MKKSDIHDGLSNTIMLMESSGKGVKWMEPRDLSQNEAIGVLTTNQHPCHLDRRDGFLTTKDLGKSWNNVVYADTHVYRESQMRDSSVANALLTIDGNEDVPDGLDESYYRSPTVTTTIKWGLVYSLSVFVALSLIPALVWRRQVKTSKNLSC